MKLNRNIGTILLAIWLILTGLLPLINLRISGIGTIMAVLAIVAGVFILLRDRLGRVSKSFTLTANLGMLLLAIWLILTGLLSVLSVNFPSSGTVLSVLAIAAGVLILLRR